MGHRIVTSSVGQGSDNGYVRIHRRLYRHPVFHSLAEASVFAWIVSEAAWRPVSVAAPGGSQTLEVGEVLLSKRLIAQDFSLSRTTVDRLLERLSNEKMIRLKTGHASCHYRAIYAVLNYAEYQSVNGDLESGTGHKAGHDRAAAGPQQGHNRATRPQIDEQNQPVTPSEEEKKGRREEGNKRKREESDSCVEAIERGETVVVGIAPQPAATEPVAAKPKKKAAQQDMPAEMLGDFERWWSEYPKVRQVAKGLARPAYRRARTKATGNELLEGLRRMRFSTAPRFIPHPSTWLNGEKWLDNPEAHRTDPDAGRERADPLAWLKKRQAAEAQEEMTLEGEVIDSTILEPEWKI